MVSTQRNICLGRSPTCVWTFTNTQTNLNLLEKYGSYEALEVHVKDFMIRHAKLLGLDNPHDIALLQRLKLQELNKLKKGQE